MKQLNATSVAIPTALGASSVKLLMIFPGKHFVSHSAENIMFFLRLSADNLFTLMFYFVLKLGLAGSTIQLRGPETHDRLHHLTLQVNLGLDLWYFAQQSRVPLVSNC